MAINWNPTPAQEVVQNVATILATASGSVPLARSLGTPQDIVDAPQSIAGQGLRSAVVQSVRTYEPRAKVLRVDLTPNADGRLIATVVIGAA